MSVSGTSACDWLVKGKLDYRVSLPLCIRSRSPRAVRLMGVRVYGMVMGTRRYMP